MSVTYIEAVEYGTDGDGDYTGEILREEVITTEADALAAAQARENVAKTYTYRKHTCNHDTGGTCTSVVVIP